MLMDELCYSRLVAQGCECYEQLRVVDDMNDLGSRELRPLDAMNNSELWIIWTIPYREPKALNVMNTLGLLMTLTNQGRELKALESMICSGFWMIWKTSIYELKALDAMNRLGISMT